MVSIIIPVYNVAPFLKECLESVYSQTYKEYEVIAINDGSTDESLEALKQFKKNHNDLRIISQENLGPGATRNRGLLEAKGDYVYFLDADDVIEPDLLKHCLLTMNEKNCDMVIFEANIFGDISNRDKSQYLFASKCTEINVVISGIEFFKKNNKQVSLVNTPMVLFKKEFLTLHSLNFMENVLHEDVEFYYRLINNNPKIVITNKVLYHRRYRQNSIMTTNISIRKLYDLIKVYMRISEMDIDKEIKEKYIYDAFKGIRESLKKIVDNDLRRRNELENDILECYKNNYDVIKQMGFLAKCQYYKGLSFLLDQYQYKENVVNIFSEKINTICEITGLYNENYLVGIYGTGDITDLFLECCKDVKGKYPSNVVYIDTTKKTNSSKYKGSYILNIGDVIFDKLRCIIISSELYDTQIYSNVKQLSPRTIAYKITKDFDNV